MHVVESRVTVPQGKAAKFALIKKKFKSSTKIPRHTHGCTVNFTQLSSNLLSGKAKFKKGILKNKTGSSQKIVMEIKVVIAIFQ